MVEVDLPKLLGERYPMRFDRLELLRDGGSMSYAAYSGGVKYFVRVIRPALMDTAQTGAEVHNFLQARGFPVTPIVHGRGGLPYVKTDDGLCILIEYIEGEDAEPERDAEALGALVGRLHREMRDYPGAFVARDKPFYIGRYIDILRGRGYPGAEAFAQYGDMLWDKLKRLPRGYCHGDLYCGNIRRTPEGKLYMHDFDTSCEGFPMYDVALLCDRTEYFHFYARNYLKSKQVLVRFLTEYRKFRTVSGLEENAFCALIASCALARRKSPKLDDPLPLKPHAIAPKSRITS